MPLKLHWRGKIWHYRGTVAGRRLRGSTGTADKRTAERIASEIEGREWRRHLDGPGAHVTMAQAAIAYRDAGKPTRFLEPVEDYWRDTPIREVTAGGIKQSARTLYPKAKAATRNRQVIAPTVAIINHAAEMEWCAPIKVARFKEATKTKKEANRAWVEAFAAEAAPHLGALAYFMLGTGARIGEAVALRWIDVDLDRRTALVNATKVEAEREAHLPPPVVAALANIPSNRKPDDPVFGYAGPRSVKNAWESAIERAGIERLTPHSCRHGFATTMLRAGYDPKTVAERGGWASAATVLKHYAHAREDRTVTDAIFDTPVTHGDDADTPNPRQKRRNGL